jgi:cation transporter-like permease
MAMRGRPGFGLSRDELEKARPRSLADSLSDQEILERRAQIQSLLEVELAGSGSLNARGTTLAGLVGATIPLVANFAGTWLDAKWRLSNTVRDTLTVLLIPSLAGLAASALFALTAVWPFSQWRPQLQELVGKLGAPADARAETQLLLEALEHQRAKNEQKARRMRWSYLLLIAGALLVLAQAATFAIAANSLAERAGAQAVGAVGAGVSGGASGSPAGASALPPRPPSAAKTRASIRHLKIATPLSMEGYGRDRFPHWISRGGGCDTRKLVLIRDGRNVKVGSGCRIISGTWRSYYDGLTLTSASRVHRPHRAARQRVAVRRKAVG